MTTFTQSFEVLDRKTPFKGFFSVDCYRLRHQRFDGSWSNVMTREVMDRGHCAGVMLYDPERDKVVLIEQFRLAAHLAGLNPWQLEIVAGFKDPGEADEEVARREVREEAGTEIKALKEISTYMPSGGACSETITLYIGQIDSEGLNGQCHGLAEENEDIRVKVLSFDDAFQIVEQGKISNSPLLITLLWLKIYKDSLKAEWR